MTPEERERAEQYAGWIRSTNPTEAQIIEQYVAFAREERARAMEEAARVSCYMCREGMPLQRNGYRHNDKNGKDTVINNLCNGAVFLQRAKALREEGGQR